MISTNFKPFPVLTTERLLLREVTLEDVNDILALRSDEDCMRYIDRPRAQTKDDAREYIRRIIDMMERNDGVNWGISLKGTNNIIGTISYWQMQKEHDRAEIGYMISPQYQGKGLMQEALEAVLKYGFEVMKLHSIEANVNPSNDRSIKILEKNNFKREAYFRENYFYNGQYIDSAIYCLLDRDMNQ
ncbi:MAG: GNAT family N-acetyltransferase [Candidatus Dadabacteria bacterium]